MEMCTCVIALVPLITSDSCPNYKVEVGTRKKVPRLQLIFTVMKSLFQLETLLALVSCVMRLFFGLQMYSLVFGVIQFSCTLHPSIIYTPLSARITGTPETFSDDFRSEVGYTLDEVTNLPQG